MGIARTFQNIRLFNDMSALDNVKVGMHNTIKCPFAASVLRLPAYYKSEKIANEKARETAKKYINSIDAGERDFRF